MNCSKWIDPQIVKYKEGGRREEEKEEEEEGKRRKRRRCRQRRRKNKRKGNKGSSKLGSIILPSDPLNLERAVQRCPKEEGHLRDEEPDKSQMVSFLIVTHPGSAVCMGEAETKRMSEQGNNLPNKLVQTWKRLAQRFQCMPWEHINPSRGSTRKDSGQLCLGNAANSIPLLQSQSADRSTQLTNP